MPIRMILISTFMAELLCFGKSNTRCGFFGYYLQRLFYSEEMPFTTQIMAPTFVNVTFHILTQPKSSTSIDPSQSNCLSSKMSFLLYGK